MRCSRPSSLPCSQGSILAPSGISIHSRSDCGSRTPKVAKLRPDWDSRIRREDIWRETDIEELARDFAHGAKRDGAISFRFARIAEDQIERNPNASQVRLARRFEHFINPLMTFVHQLQHRLRRSTRFQNPCARRHSRPRSRTSSSLIRQRKSVDA